MMLKLLAALMLVPAVAAAPPASEANAGAAAESASVARVWQPITMPLARAVLDELAAVRKLEEG